MKKALISLRHSLQSWRTTSVALLYISSGLPLGLVWIGIPDWMRTVGVDIRIIGLFALTQLPWSLKYLWAPMMDRFAPFMGRRRGWIFIAQVALFAFTLGLAGLGHHPESPWVVAAFALAIAIASATQDIALDAYTVDVLNQEEYGVISGARIAMYRAAMFIAGGLAITLAGNPHPLAQDASTWTTFWHHIVTFFDWPKVNILLALLYGVMMLITWRAPEPPQTIQKPKTILDAFWLPFLGFLSKHRALEMLIFVVMYKFADNLAEALRSPFLVDMGYSSTERGVALKTVGLICTLSGVFLGGISTNFFGLGRCLWIFGLLMMLSNVGYILLSMVGYHLPTFYISMALETFIQGLGTGAFSVLLLRMTQKRFSATQYALFTSMFAFPRILGGIISGLTVDALGWTQFYVATIFMGIPGLLLLHRFSPLGVKEPTFDVEEVKALGLNSSQIKTKSILIGFIAMGISTLLLGLLQYAKDIRLHDQDHVSLMQHLVQLYVIDGLASFMTVFGMLVFSITVALCAAAYYVARSTQTKPLT